jgi:hypothetical protein
MEVDPKEYLIELVRARELIYNKQAQYYKHKGRTARAWREISRDHPSFDGLTLIYLFINCTFLT